MTCDALPGSTSSIALSIQPSTSPRSGRVEPVDASAPETFELRVGTGPSEVRIFRPRSLCVVMREQCRVLVAPLAEALEPRRERCVQTRALPLRQAAVGDLARQRVLD